MSKIDFPDQGGGDDQDRLARAGEGVFMMDQAPELTQSENLNLVAATSTPLSTILGAAVDARAASVTIVNHDAALIIHIKGDGTAAAVTNGKIAPLVGLKLTGKKVNFDKIRLFSTGTPNVGVLVFSRPVQKDL